MVLSMLPRAFPAAVLVVQHLDWRSRSYLAELLARDCRMPVFHADAGEAIHPGAVYVAPPGTHLTLTGDHVRLGHEAPRHFARPSVDVLFESVASTCGPDAIGVILTGTGVDGADGLRAIKRAGGRTIVQEPATAEFRGMPAAAEATGCADMMLPLAGIAPALLGLLRAGALASEEGAETT
jgi:two-component system, chemotaxis family, protein-glutamate methylesterase/glutaminase